MIEFIGIIVGVISGLTWQYLSTTPFDGHPTLVESLIVSTTTKSIHMHHWVIYLILAIVVSVLSIKYNRLNHPAVLFILSFLVAAIVLNILKYSDWYKFIN